MKVAYILNSTTPYGGATKAILSLLKELMSRGVEPFIVMPDKKGIYDELTKIGFDVFATPYRSNSYPNIKTVKDLILFFPRLIARRYLNLIATHKLNSEIRERGINLIHTNVSVVDIGYRCAFNLDLPHVYHIREYADLDFNIHYYPCKRIFHQSLNKKKSFTICITKAIQRHHGQQSSSKSKVIYDSIRPIAQTRPSFVSGDYFLYAGRIQKTKGLDLLLQAYVLCLLRHEAILPLKIAGEPSSREYIHELELFINQNHLEEKVEFLGERKDVNALMAEARALIVPSRYEGFGLCMPEAMFNGCLVIAHDKAGTKEQLDNGVQLTGQEIALRFKTTEQLSVLLHSVSTSKADMFVDMKNRAFDVVNQLYTSERNAEQVLEFYNEIIKYGND